MDLSSFMEKQTKQASASPDAIKDFSDDRIPEGHRNNTMSRIAASLLKRYGDSQKAYEKFIEESEKCEPPLPEDELKTIWSSALRFLSKIEADDDYIDPEEFNDPTPRRPDDYSDLGQALKFVEFYEEKIRYSGATDYLVYDGCIWQESETGAQAAIHEFTGQQLKEAGRYLKMANDYMSKTGAFEKVMKLGKKRALAELSEDQKKAYSVYEKAEAYLKFIIKRRDTRYLAAALKEARPMVEIDPALLDADGFLLNTPEYTVDLRKGMNGIRAHSGEDYITKCTAAVPGDEGSEIWEDALETIFCGDKDLIEYVQQIAGLAAIGHVFVETLVIAYGDGRNGKSTFWNTVRRVLGSYSGSISADVMTAGCRRNIKPEIAEARGKRILIAAELEEGMRLSTSVLKQFCSTDEVQAEKKFKAPFEFIPTHTLVLYTNHLPKVGANDSGTWRKIIVVPFGAKIEGDADIKNYADHLFDNAGGAVLKWIIEGASKVIASDFHIKEAECVRLATEKYRDDSDWFACFLEDCCEIDESASAPSGELYRRYRDHCAVLCEYARSTSDFYSALEHAGFSRKRTAKGRMVSGLRLKPELLMEI